MAVTLDDIHAIRIKLATAQQPSLRPQLDTVLRTASRLGHAHCLSLSGSALDGLLTTAEFLWVAKGQAITPGSNHCYRLVTTASLRYLPWEIWDTATLTALSPDAFAVNLSQLYASEGSEWASLSRYARGQYMNRREFSWWTCDSQHLKYTEAAIIRHAHYAGIAHDYLSVDMTLLRIATPNVQHLMHIPTIVDGVDSTIFLPKSQDDAAPGRCIDLANIPLTLGATEYAVSPVSVKDIEFRPFRIRRSILNNGLTPFLATILSPLHEFYTASL
jgi:hypothetical protein